MNKCKKCKEEINLIVLGIPDDICWGCSNPETKDKCIDTNIELKQKLGN